MGRIIKTLFFPNHPNRICPLLFRRCGSGEGIPFQPGYERRGLPEGAGAGGEVGLCGGQHHADALQGQPAIPDP